MTYTPDPALVRHVTARVIDGATEVLRDTLTTYTLTDDERSDLDYGQQCAVIRAAQGMLGEVKLGYVLPGQDATLIDAAISNLYAAGQIDQAAAVRHLADHQASAATDWVDTRPGQDGRAYPLDCPITDGLGDDWTHAGWATYIDSRRPVPLMRCGPNTCLITDVIDANRGHLTADPAKVGEPRDITREITESEA